MCNTSLLLESALILTNEEEGTTQCFCLFILTAKVRLEITGLLQLTITVKSLLCPGGKFRQVITQGCCIRVTSYLCGKLAYIIFIYIYISLEVHQKT